MYCSTLNFWTVLSVYTKFSHTSQYECTLHSYALKILSALSSIQECVILDKPHVLGLDLHMCSCQMPTAATIINITYDMSVLHAIFFCYHYLSSIIHLYLVILL